MLGFVIRLTVALASSVICTMADAAAVSHMVERRVTNADGKTATILVNRELTHTSNKVLRTDYGPSSTFFPSDQFVSLCTPTSDIGSTVIDSPYTEDCSYILSYYRSEDHWGWWNLDGLVPGVDYAFIKHNTCSLYGRVPDGHTSLQISNADAEVFVNTTIKKYSTKFDDGKFDRVQGDGTIDCWESNGAVEVVATLSLRR
ncbi:hypothetical protein PFICI_10624 [Pestalotiopsis fici W106-1]|uniref:Ecp2 effector protein-like domain-containing protein n=1 Tax=Pestalotiopsis fici (strain W106-1 / CGMCC3.15140) TaxID=1229662 RepID=W3WZJ6_PESFW|nr:uncharacterized protein PFICI_10624 [Pestalotiopsis fici W106-1]ETS78562.1 hypothetical protein PFICI_10624 [Pestalotiopsis fici W106-1]